MKPSVHRRALARYLDDLLAIDQGGDYCPNGLQVEGREDVERLVTGVSACRELFVRARQSGAHAVLVHHGIFWDGAPSVLTGLQYGRVRELIVGELNLLAYHLPLDAHPEVGNNALAAVEFGLIDQTPFAQHKGQAIGFHGRFPQAIAAEELFDRCRRIYGQEPLVFDSGPPEIQTLGIVSGGAQRDFYTAIDAGLDAFITGEVSEWVMNVAREAGVHYLAAGHYATERLGVKKLGELVAERFGIDVEFMDLPNPV